MGQPNALQACWRSRNTPGGSALTYPAVGALRRSSLPGTFTPRCTFYTAVLIFFDLGCNMPKKLMKAAWHKRKDRMHPRQQRPTRPPATAPAMMAVLSVEDESPGNVRISVTEIDGEPRGRLLVSMLEALAVDARLVVTWVVTDAWVEASGTAIETEMRTEADVTVIVTMLLETPVRVAAIESLMPSTTVVV